MSTSSSALHYVYVNYAEGERIIYSCYANGILEADAMLLKDTGIVAEKANYIGCKTP